MADRVDERLADGERWILGDFLPLQAFDHCPDGHLAPNDLPGPLDDARQRPGDFLAPTVACQPILAARRGELLKYIPCYCGCERVGHRSNHDCYVKGVTPDGRPKWDDHAFT